MQQLPTATKKTGTDSFPPANDGSEMGCASALLQSIPVVMQSIRSIANVHRARGLTIPQFRTLGFIAKNPNASLSDIAELLGLALPSVSRTVNTLVQHGWLERKALAHDRRQLQLKLKPAGTRVFQAAIEQTREAMARRLAALPESRRARITAAMADLHALFGPDAAEKGTLSCVIVTPTRAASSRPARARRASSPKR